MRYRTIAALAAIAAIGIACGAGDDGGDAAGGSSEAAQPKAEVKTLKVGQAARDGKFEFIVSKPDCGKTSVGPSIVAEKAQGQFCILPVKVKNIGKEAQMFDGSSQKAYDAKGTEYSNATAAELALNGGNDTFLQEINPGNQVSGKLVFDVPKGTKLTKIKLHDSAFSGGVTVALS